MVHPRLKTTQNSQRRKSVRTGLPKVKGQVWTLSKARSTAHNVTMRNISAGGALLASVTPMDAGQRVHCTFALPGGGHYALAARVVRCTETAHHFEVAVEFTLTQSNEEQLMRWVFCWIAIQQRAAMGVPTPATAHAKL